MGGIEHRLAGNRFQFLREISDSESRAFADRSFVRRILAEDHPEQGRLADAIRADQTHTGSRSKMCGRSF